MAVGVYKGFSSFEFLAKKSFRLIDVELVKLDLLNHIFTSRGERVMMPNFGTSIPDMVFEPLDEDTIDRIEDELQLVFDYDPRVSLISLDIAENLATNSLIVAALLNYVELNTTELFDFNIEFEGAQ
jgi:phage baseplate assembly protein W